MVNHDCLLLSYRIYGAKDHFLLFSDSEYAAWFALHAILFIEHHSPISRHVQQHGATNKLSALHAFFAIEWFKEEEDPRGLSPLAAHVCGRFSRPTTTGIELRRPFPLIEAPPLLPICCFNIFNALPIIKKRIPLVVSIKMFYWLLDGSFSDKLIVTCATR